MRKIFLGWSRLKTRQLRTPVKVALSGVTMFVCVITVFGVRAYSDRSARAPRKADASPPSDSIATNRPQPSAAIEAEVITIRPTGFDPPSITRHRGEFVLAVQNRSGLQTVDLTIEDQSRRSLYAGRMPIIKPDITRRFGLVPGTYVLRETHHPDWSCTITIEDR